MIRTSKLFKLIPVVFVAMSMLFILGQAMFISIFQAAPVMAQEIVAAKHAAVYDEIDVYSGQSIQAALDTAQPGDTVTVHEGVYHETLTMPSGNTSTLTLKAAAGERVIITGMSTITGWSPYTESVWVATTNSKPTKLIVGAQEQQLAREPNEGWWDPETVDLNGPAPIFGDVAHLQEFPYDMSGGEAFVFKMAAFVYHVYPIQSFDRINGQFTLDTTIDKFSVDDIYWLQGSKELIDQPGEWAAEEIQEDQYNIYFWPKSVDDLAMVETPIESKAMISVNGGQNIRIEGLEVTGSQLYGIHVYGNSQNVEVEKCIVHHSGHAGIYVRYSQDVRIANNIIVYNRYGFDSDNDSNLVVEQNEIAWNAEDGLKISVDSTDVTVQRNFIHDHISWDHPDGFQTYVNPNNLHYIENLCVASGQTFMVGDTYDVAFRGNMSIGTFGSGLIIAGNGTHNWNLLNNTFAFAGYFPVSFGQGSRIFDVRENVFVNGHQNYLYQVLASHQYTGDRNLFWKSSRLDSSKILSYENNWSVTLEQFRDLTGQEANSANVDPLFRNAPLLFSMLDERLVHQSTRDTLILRATPQGWNVGDIIDVNLDGVPRTITAINGNAITFSPPLERQILSYGFVANWGPNATNLALDLRFQDSSPANMMGVDGKPIGSQIDIAAYCRGDFNGDGVREIPLLPPELVRTGYAGCPSALDTGLVLQGRPADQTIYLNWDVGIPLFPTTTWTISYEGTPGIPSSPITGIEEPTRAYTLTNLTNYERYNITLSTVGMTPVLSDTVQVMPTDRSLYLTLIHR